MGNTHIRRISGFDNYVYDFQTDTVTNTKNGKTQCFYTHQSVSKKWKYMPYNSISLNRNDGKRQRISKARMIALCFYDYDYIKSKKLTVNHIDSNPQNDSLENLELVSQKLNNRKAKNCKKHKEYRKINGELIIEKARRVMTNELIEKLDKENG